jgi:hypothetical protein
MHRLGLLLAALAGPCLLRAQETPNTIQEPPPAITTTSSPAYPQITVTGSDPMACVDTLQLGADTRDQLTSLLELGPTWRFPVHIHIMSPGDPLLAKVDHAASAVFSQGATMRIEAVLPSNDPNPREFIQRQYVTALLYEKFFAKTTNFDRDTRLDIVPMWLIEGLRESLNVDPAHDRESIVRRAVKSQSTPTLAEVTGWRELSDDRLLGIWQRAFSYYLVECLTEPGPRLDDFHKWLQSFSGDTSAIQNFPTETDWQRELNDAAQRSHDIVYTWNETLSELTDDETITYPDAKTGKVQSCTIDDVLNIERTPAVIDALTERGFLLTQLELRAHPSWHNVLESYRSALTLLVAPDKTDEARRLLEQAHRESVAEMDRHQKLLDYVNWFEVTRDYSDNRPSRFDSYFSTAKAMESIQGDPDHPNPIRASLLQVESQL